MLSRPEDQGGNLGNLEHHHQYKRRNIQIPAPLRAADALILLFMLLWAVHCYSYHRSLRNSSNASYFRHNMIATFENE
jgi:hypothetical protein